MPINYSKYPPNWKSEIVPFVKERAKHKCEFCGVDNYAIGYRDSEGVFHQPEMSVANDILYADEKFIKIVLTIAHLDHDESNHDVKMDRLAALCQQCHLRYDAKEKARRRFEKKHANQFKLEL